MVRSASWRSRNTVVLATHVLTLTAIDERHRRDRRRPHHLAALREDLAAADRRVLDHVNRIERGFVARVADAHDRRRMLIDFTLRRCPGAEEARRARGPSRRRWPMRD